MNNITGNAVENAFKAVLKTLKKNKVMVKILDDCIYVRLAGDVEKGEAYSIEWGKVLSIKNTNQ